MTDPGPPQWERMVLEKVALKAIEEQRRTRQWSALFKLLWFTFAFLLLGAALGWYGPTDKESGRASIGKHTAVVDVEGVIAPEEKASTARSRTRIRRAW
jgi:protease-4